MAENNAGQETCPSCGNGELRTKCEVCHFTGFVNNEEAS